MPKPQNAQRDQCCVAIRLRPPQQEHGQTASGGAEGVTAAEFVSKHCRNKRFNHVFQPDVLQSPPDVQNEVYQRFASHLPGLVLSGGNSCLLAYGQTGSGKTYAVFGTDEEPGILLQFCTGLFEAKAARETSAQASGSRESFEIKISYIEVFNNVVHDLLAPAVQTEQGGKRARSTSLGPNTATRVSVSTADQLRGIIRLGSTRRRTRATEYNDHSSRSHAIVRVFVEQSGPSRTRAYAEFVDLAGSECVSANDEPQEVTPDQKACKAAIERKTEGNGIGKSSAELSRCNINLAKRSTTDPRAPVIFASATLTKVLEESLDGGAELLVIATVNPADRGSLSTLDFAATASNIVIPRMAGCGASTPATPRPQAAAPATPVATDSPSDQPSDRSVLRPDWSLASDPHASGSASPESSFSPLGEHAAQATPTRVRQSAAGDTALPRDPACRWATRARTVISCCSAGLALVALTGRPWISVSQRAELIVDFVSKARNVKFYTTAGLPPSPVGLQDAAHDEVRRPAHGERHAPREMWDAAVAAAT